MALVEVKFRNNIYKLDTDNPERICELSLSVNKMVEELSKSSHGATDTKMAFMAALMLQDKLLSKTEDSTSAEKLEDLLADTIINVASYVNHLADKYEKR
jgi:cell division protein ZapA (FtsZ GTPase activity inhibitor)